MKRLLLTLHFLSAFGFISSTIPTVAAAAASGGGSPPPTPSRCEFLFVQTLSTDVAVSRGRSVFYEIVRAEPGRPTFVVFNGLVFPLNKYDSFRDEFIRLRDGEGLILMSYSTQPESLLQTEGARSIAQRERSVNTVSLDDFALEMDAILGKEMIQGEIVPVGLSFGAAPLTAFLKQFALKQVALKKFSKSRSPYKIRDAVFIAPLVVPGDTQPGAVQSKMAVEMNFGLIPIWGDLFIENSRDAVAGSMAQALVSQSAQTSRSKYLIQRIGNETLVENLKAQIRSVETFDLRDVELPSGVRVLFALAENENPLRRANQDEAAEKLKAKVVEIKGSLHATVADRPLETANLLLELTRNREGSRSRR